MLPNNNKCTYLLTHVIYLKHIWLWNLPAVSVITLLKKELNYQPKLHQLYVLLSQATKFDSNACLCTLQILAVCIALAAEIHCYLYNHKRQDSKTDRRPCQKTSIYRQAILGIGHKNYFSAKKVSLVILQPTVISGHCTKWAEYKWTHCMCMLYHKWLQIPMLCWLPSN